MVDSKPASASAVNSQIVDSVEFVSAHVLGQSPALAAGAVYQSLAHATGLLLHNAVAAQQQEAIVAQAAVNVGTLQIYRQGGRAEDLGALLAALRAGGPPDAAAPAGKKKEV